MEEAMKQKQKELERINKRMRDLRQFNDKVDEPIDKAIFISTPSYIERQLKDLVKMNMTCKQSYISCLD